MMKALLLAAGRGERMRPLSDACPKALLPVHGKPLIQWHIEALRRAGIVQIVINTAWLGEILERALGDGNALGVHLTYSREGEALETAGGIRWALPLLGEVFWAAAADAYAPGFDYHVPPVLLSALQSGERDAHLWLMPNPPHHASGDFCLAADARLADKSSAAPPENTLTFSGIGLYRAALFAPLPERSVAPLAPLLRGAMKLGRVSGEIYRGEWADIGTPERLRQIQAAPNKRPTA